MRILYLDPFHGGSHRTVAEDFARHSRHSVELLTLSQAGGWRWRMRGAAITFARMLRQRRGAPGWDRIVATDMLDLATFLGLTRDLTAGVPIALYLHENQLTYPLPPGRARDLAFPWINYTSALAADALFFNSEFHRRSFLDALPGLPGRYHDHQELEIIETIARRSRVLPPGIDLARLDAGDALPASERAAPVILWNSRWEYDKDPPAFFAALAVLEARGVDFRVIVAGEHIDPGAPAFAEARSWLAPRALAWGYIPDPASYRRLLWQADIVVSTAVQEFFGISLVEALYCGCVPILPRRLSYPELLPAEHHAACLYDSQDELVDKLQAAIENLAALRARDFRTVAARYDWSRMAPCYDDALERLAPMVQ